MRRTFIGEMTVVAAAALALALGRSVATHPSVQASQDSTLAPATVALGDSIFHGKKAGGICFTCHGANARGTPGLAPNLTDAKWLHGDGSYAFIVGIVEKGVPKPKESAAPMLPKGGASLTAAQLRAVAAYVYSLSHK
jgi:mono/diheme cytochrome c family protein